MKRYLLDTAPLAAVLHGRPAAVALVEPWMRAHEVATSSLMYAEVVEYIMGKPPASFAFYHTRLKTLLGEIVPYSLTYPMLERYAAIRRSLRPPTRPWADW